MRHYDVVLLGKELNLRFGFSLNFKDIMKGFAETLSDLVSNVMQIFGDTTKCVAR